MKDLVAALLEQANLKSGGSKTRVLSILLTDDQEIRAISAQYLQSREITDVLSFQYDPLPDEEPALFAEVIVNVQRAAEEGARRQRSTTQDRHAWGPNHELALYLAHGIDHLTGLDDADAQGRRRMRRRELEWLRTTEAAGLLDNLIA